MSKKGVSAEMAADRRHWKKKKHVLPPHIKWVKRRITAILLLHALFLFTTRL